MIDMTTDVCIRNGVQVRDKGQFVEFGGNYGIDGALVQRFSEEFLIKTFNVKDQGTGRGTKILECIIDFTGKEAKPIVLTAHPNKLEHLDRLTAFYERHGFKTEEWELEVGRQDVDEVWLPVMRRMPD